MHNFPTLGSIVLEIMSEELVLHAVIVPGQAVAYS